MEHEPMTAISKELADLIDRQYRESQGLPEPEAPIAVDPEAVQRILSRHEKASVQRHRDEALVGHKLAPYADELDDAQTAHLLELQAAEVWSQNDGQRINMSPNRTAQQVHSEIAAANAALANIDVNAEVDRLRAKLQYDSEGVEIGASMAVDIPEPR
jgi:hypothetical protein